MINLKDIAKQAGVSTSTASRVLNGKKYISPEKRAQILQLIQDTGYVPNKAARNMVMKRSFTVGIIIPSTFNMFQRQLFSVIERTLSSFGYHTGVFLIPLDGTGVRECLDRLKAENLDGLILLHEIKSPAFYEFVAQSDLPVVSTLCNFDDVPTVKTDDKRAAIDAVNHLISLGHRKIGLICDVGFSYGRCRMQAYHEALTAAGIEPSDDRIACVQQYSSEFGMYGMRELLLRGGDLTAIFAASDELAIGAIRVLKDEGIRVPEDISVIGFDDIEISNYYIPRLTTIHQPIKEIGDHAALGLHRRISGGSRLDSEIIIPHKMIIRETTRFIAR
jgi:LacI family transcriptional regulator